jgi:iron complex outermembrane recepter protein
MSKFFLRTIKKYLKTKFSLFFLSILSYATIAQETLKGKVIDAKDGSDVIGATVAIKASNIVAVTNAKGEFSIKIKQKFPVTLKVSSIGYELKELTVNSAESLNIALSESATVIRYKQNQNFREQFQTFLPSK